MARTMTTIASGLLLLVAGCGRHTGEPAANGDGQTTPGTTFNLRLSGDDPGEVSAARMRIQAVQVTNGAQVLANAVLTPEVDLARTDQAYLLASFDVPAGVEDVEFLVGFESGTLTTAHGSFAVDGRCQTLRLGGKVSRIAERRHAVIQLDVGRSFVPSAAGMMLVPHVQLVY